MNLVAEVEYIYKTKAMEKLAKVMAEKMASHDVEVFLIDGTKPLGQMTDDELTDLMSEHFETDGIKYQVYTNPPGDKLLYKTILEMTRLEAEERMLKKLTQDDDWKIILFNFTTMLCSGFKGFGQMDDEELAKLCMDICYREKRTKVIIKKGINKDETNTS